MRKFFFFAAFSALVLASCNKEQGPSVPVQEQKSVEVFFTINGDGMTKSVGNTYANESKVNDLQIYVFNEDGTIADYKAAGAAMSTSLLTSSGMKTIWAVVNAPDMSGAETLDAFLAKTSSLADNGLDNFVMTGSTTAELTDGATIAITVKRAVARVSIAKISSGFTSTLLASKELKIKGIYMINVAGQYGIGFTGEPSVWYNKLGHEDASLDVLLYDAVENHVLTPSAPYEKEHAFYPYPNATEDDPHADEWSPRHSILTIEVEFDGEQGWYPIVLPQIERNKTYVIEEVVITRSPSDKPYVPVETGESTAGITVAEWELGLNLGTITI